MIGCFEDEDDCVSIHDATCRRWRICRWTRPTHSDLKDVSLVATINAFNVHTVWLARPAATPAVVGVVTGVTVARAAAIPAEDDVAVEAHDADETHDEETHEAGQAADVDSAFQL